MGIGGIISEYDETNSRTRKFWWGNIPKEAVNSWSERKKHNFKVEIQAIRYALKALRKKPKGS